MEEDESESHFAEAKPDLNDLELSLQLCLNVEDAAEALASEGASAVLFSSDFAAGAASNDAELIETTGAAASNDAELIETTGAAAAPTNNAILIDEDKDCNVVLRQKPFKSMYSLLSLKFRAVQLILN